MSVGRTIRWMPASSVGHPLLFTAFALLLFGSTSAAGADEKVALQESPAAVARTQSGVAYEIGGHLSMRRDGEVAKLPMTVSAKMSYHDVLVGNDDQPNNEELSINRRYVRHYDDIDCQIQIQDTKFSPELRDERRIVGTWIADGERFAFSPSGHLTRDELDLIDTLGDSQLAGLLLPTEPVALGGTWKVPDDAMALQHDGGAVGQTDLECVLSELDDDAAKIEARGTVHGAFGGVATEIEVRARLTFDRQKQLVTRMELLTKEERPIGHIGPGVEATSKLRLQRLPLKSDGKLSKAVVESVPFPPERELLQLDFTPANERYGLIHDRTWHVTGDQPTVTILRLVHRGELIAQCNITPQSARVEGTPTDLESFRQRVQETLGERFIQFVESSQEQEDGRTVIRAVVDGKVEELPIRWIYYLVKGDGDEMLSLSFTVEGDLISKFGTSDRQLVERITLSKPKQPTVAEKKAAGGMKSILKR